VSAFLFRINENHYILQSSLSDVLDLSYFYCSNVQISLAVVNVKNPSNFSPSLSIFVHGVDFGRTSLAEDLRPGFEGHSVMQFDWKRVVNPNVESLQIKVLAIPPSAFVSQPEVCGFPFLPESYTVNLPTNATSYELSAPDPDHLPLFGPRILSGECSYFVTLVYSLKVGTYSAPRTLTCNTPTGSMRPPVDYSCRGEIDTITGLLTAHLNWNYEYNPIVEDVILKKTMFLQSFADRDFEAGNIDLDPERSSFELTNPNGKLFCDDKHRSTVNYTQTILSGVVSESVVLNNLCVFDHDENVYEFQLNFPPNLTVYWWRSGIIPDQRTCVLNSKALPPGQIDPAIALDCDTKLVLQPLPEDKTQYSISIGFSWEPPKLLRGGNKYEVSISGDIDRSGIHNPLTATVVCGYDNNNFVCIRNIVHRRTKLRSRL
jgi:hypothetical protein